MMLSDDSVKAYKASGCELHRLPHGPLSLHIRL